MCRCSSSNTLTTFTVMPKGNNDNVLPSVLSNISLACLGGYIHEAPVVLPDAKLLHRTNGTMKGINSLVSRFIAKEKLIDEAIVVDPADVGSYMANSNALRAANMRAKFLNSKSQIQISNSTRPVVENDNNDNFIESNNIKKNCRYNNVPHTIIGTKDICYSSY